MSHELLPWLFGMGVIAAACVLYHRRLNRMISNYRQLEEYADTLLQHAQGTMLSVQGLVTELRAEDPVRQRIEDTLERADRHLSKVREQMQPLCSEQQQDRIR